MIVVKQQTLPRTTTGRLTAAELRVARTFAEAVDVLAAGASDSAVMDALRRRSPLAVDAAMPFDLWRERLAAMSGPIRREVLDGLVSTAGTLPFPIGRDEAKRMFDVNDPRAYAWAERHAASRAITFTDTQRQAVRRVVTAGFADGLTADEIALTLRDSVGVHPRQAATTARVRQRAAKQALARGATERAAAKQAESAARRYARTAVNRRAKSIARTEVMTAANQGRWLGWQQAVDSRLIDRVTVRKRWVVAPSGSSLGPPCNVCAPFAAAGPMPLDFHWQTQFGLVRMPPAHPSCRCTATIVRST